MTTEWISARVAAELTGIPEDTIEWWIRQGSFERRPRRGNQPTLNRASVEAFAATYIGKRKGRAKKPRGITRGEWFENHLSLADLAQSLEVSTTTLRNRVAAGELQAERHPTRPWLRVTPAEAERFKAEHTRWITLVTAAELIGCSVSHVKEAIKRGEIASRPSQGPRPCVERPSVLTYRDDTYPTILRKRSRKDDQADKSPGPQPPDNENVWIRPATAALIVGISRGRISQLLRKEAIPHARIGRHFWIRRDHLEVWAAARRAARHKAN